MVRENLFARHGEFFAILLKAGQNGEVALIQYRTEVPLDVAGAGALLRFGSTVLRHGRTGRNKRKDPDDEEISVHGSLCA
jgi:hypothetical protein